MNLVPTNALTNVKTILLKKIFGMDNGSFGPPNTTQVPRNQKLKSGKNTDFFSEKGKLSKILKTKLSNVYSSI